MTMCRSHRHPERDLVFYIFEDQHEVLARHMLLISILLDETLTPRDRVEIFLEVFGNANVREKCAAYVAEQGKKLASVVLEASEGKGGKESSTPLGRMFDLSMLKYGDRDNLVDQFRAYSTNVRRGGANGVEKGVLARTHKPTQTCTAVVHVSQP
mmetsp:Transcript_54266/g.172266  ORF Transcript_54266/g.172266 Transcript_54266/m.172266 type:complete len:155 (-) Transcript_54266:589-1053(-)